MSVLSIKSFFKQNFVDPDFSIINYFKAIQVPASHREVIENEIKEYVTGAIENSELESGEFIKFLVNFKKCDYMILKTDNCNKFWRDKLISDHKNKMIDQEVKRKADTVAMTRENKRIKKQNDINEDDTLLPNQIISTATKIKRHAQDIYKGQIYNDLPVQAQSAISLGFNSILDLSSYKNDSFAQRQLFTNEEWKQINDKHDKEVKYHCTPDEVKRELDKIEKKATTDLTDAYKECLHYQIRYAFKPEEVYFKVLAHFIALLKDHPDYLEPKDKTFTEGYYCIKVWGPVLEAVFNDPKLVVNWDTRSPAANKINSTSSDPDTKSIGDKFGFRICYDDDGKHIDLLNGKIEKEQRSTVKNFYDHSELARETKVIGDLFYSSTCLKRKIKKSVKVRGIHISATEGEMVECRLVDNGLYIFNKLGSLCLPSSELDLTKSTTLVKRLLEVKRGCLALARTYRQMKEQEKDLESNMDKMKTRPRSPCGDSDSKFGIPKNTKDYQDWVRGSWIPPSRYSKIAYDGTPPPYLLSPPPTL